MTKPFWPLAVNSWGRRERAMAHHVIDGDQHTMGTWVRRFEDVFAAYIGSEYAVMTNSGSSANLLAAAIAANKCGGGEVIVPAIAWSTTYAPLHQNGFDLCIADVELNTLNVDMDLVNAALRPGQTKVLVGCSILGTPAPLWELRGFAHRNNLFFIEDNCESLGASYGGRKCGTFGDVGTFSFFFSHHINTVEGGMLVTDNKDLYELALCLRAHGWTRDLPVNSSLRQFTNSSFDGAYQFVLPGYNVRPTELAAAVGLVQLDRLPEFNEWRCKNATVFQRLFANDPRWIIQPATASNPRAVPFGFTLVFRTPDERVAVSEVLNDPACLIEHRLITGGSFGRHPAHVYYRYRYADTGKTPNADRVHDCGLFVGNHAEDLSGRIEMLHLLLDKTLKE